MSSARIFAPLVPIGIRTAAIATVIGLLIRLLGATLRAEYQEQTARGAERGEHDRDGDGENPTSHGIAFLLSLSQNMGVIR